jgi:hypothetical protein
LIMLDYTRTLDEEQPNNVPTVLPGNGLCVYCTERDNERGEKKDSSEGEMRYSLLPPTTNA